jgi:uncharacterized damage-inducible protein DinB
MQTLFTDYLNLLQQCHTDILQALEGLPSTALDWAPGPDMNSINVLIYHLTGSERFWIGDVAAQESSNRNRDAEFKVHGIEMDVLKKRLADNVEYAQRILNTMSLSDLELVHTTPGNDRGHTVAWALFHALEHSSVHLGQIQLTRQLWEQSQANT